MGFICVRMSYAINRCKPWVDLLPKTSSHILKYSNFIVKCFFSRNPEFVVSGKSHCCAIFSLSIAVLTLAAFIFAKLREHGLSSQSQISNLFIALTVSVQRSDLLMLQFNASRFCSQRSSLA